MKQILSCSAYTPSMHGSLVVVVVVLHVPGSLGGSLISLTHA